MRWCLPVAVLLGLSITDAVSRAQGQGGAQRLAQQRPSSGLDEHPDSGFFASTGVVRFQIVHGRLRLDAPRHRKGCQSQDHNGVFESITVTACRGIPSMHYVCQRAEQHLTISVERASHVRIESYLPQTGERAILDQPAGGAITWVIRRGDLEDTYDGTTLLHVRNGDPDGFDMHCGALVRRLLRGRSLCVLSKATELAIMTAISEDDFATVSRDEVIGCVEQLGSHKRSIRKSAESRLVRWGTPVIPMIHSLNRDNLDTEQKARISIILKRLQRTNDDTAASLATMLVNDETYWKCLSRRLSAGQIRMANDYMNQIGLNPLVMPAEPVVRVADRSR